MNVRKVTISLPNDVFEWAESERQRLNVGRSEFLTSVLREELYRKELEERARRYEEAYRKYPATEEENEWVEWSMESLAQYWAEEEAAEDQNGTR